MEVVTYFGQCRCCLEYAYLKNMWDQHIVNEEKEVYGTMLVECFGIVWTMLEQIEDDKICEACITQLRSSFNFKNQVLLSQKELIMQFKDLMPTENKDEHKVIKPSNYDEEYDEKKTIKKRRRRRTKLEILADRERQKNNISDSDQETLKKINENTLKTTRRNKRKASIVEKKVPSDEEPLLMKNKYSVLEKEDLSDEEYILPLKKSFIEIEVPSKEEFPSKNKESSIVEKDVTSDEETAQIKKSIVIEKEMSSEEEFRSKKKKKSTNVKKEITLEEKSSPKKKSIDIEKEAPSDDEILSKMSKKSSGVEKEITSSEKSLINKKKNTTVQRMSLRSRKSKVDKEIFSDDELKDTKNTIDIEKNPSVESISDNASIDNEENSGNHELESDNASETKDVTENESVDENLYREEIPDNEILSNEIETPKDDIESIKSINKEKEQTQTIIKTRRQTRMRAETENKNTDTKEMTTKDNNTNNDSPIKTRAQAKKEEIELSSHKKKKNDVTVKKEEKSIIKTRSQLKNKKDEALDKDSTEDIPIYTESSDIIKSAKDVTKESKEEPVEKVAEQERNILESEVKEKIVALQIEIEVEQEEIKSEPERSFENPPFTDDAPPVEVSDKLSTDSEALEFADVVRSMQYSNQKQQDNANLDQEKPENSSLLDKSEELVLRYDDSNDCVQDDTEQNQTESEEEGKMPESEENVSWKNQSELNDDMRHCLDVIKGIKREKKTSEKKTKEENYSMIYPTVEVQSDSEDQEKDAIAKREALIETHRANIRAILTSTNATPIRGHWGLGYSCYFCPNQYPDPQDLKTHSYTHADQFKTFKVKSLTDHMVKLDTTNLICNICDTNISDLDEMMAHLKGIHFMGIDVDVLNHIVPFNFDSGLKCVKCGVEAESFKLLCEHMCDEHCRNYECSLCLKGFVNIQGLRSHSISHGVSIHACSYCPLVFKSKIETADHETTMHLRKNSFKCGYCDETFNRAPKKEHHEITKHGLAKNLHQCTRCSKKFDNRPSLLAHLVVHTNQALHRCTHCDRSFMYHTDLVKHEWEFHTDLDCHICGASFSTPKTLKTHMLSHEDKVYKCRLCTQNFTQYDVYCRHMKVKHGLTRLKRQ